MNSRGYVMDEWQRLCNDKGGYRAARAAKKNSDQKSLDKKVRREDFRQEEFRQEGFRREEFKQKHLCWHWLFQGFELQIYE